MVRHKLSILTMHALIAIPPQPRVETLLRQAATASELRSFLVKNAEAHFLRALNENPHVLWPLKGHVGQPWQKVFLMMQIDLAGAEYPNRLSGPARRELMQERPRMVEVLIKVVKCAIEVLAAGNDAVGVRNGLDLRRALAAGS